MDQEVVVGPDISGGREFVAKLQEAGYPIAAALWQYDELHSRFSLTLVTKAMDTSNPKRSYTRLIRAMDTVFAHSPVNETAVNLLSPDAAVAKSLRKHLKGDRDRVLNKTRIGDHFIGPGYLYFVD